jgi:hypothetical protein
MPPRTRGRRAAPPAAAAAAAAAAENAAEHAHAPELPHDVLVALLTPLAGDVAALCAAACVASAWRAAARAPSLWRELRFSTERNRRVAARRLTDARLAVLAARACGALTHLELEGCAGVTLRGVARALSQHDDAPPLALLSVRGVRAGRRDDRLYAQLLARVAAPHLLDVASVGRLVLCDATPAEDGGARCSRVCVAEDELCAACAIFCCPDCAAAAQGARAPPCGDLCDTCFQPSEEADDFFDCARCGDATAVNGHCFDCVCSCDACHIILCDKCSFEDNGMWMCSRCCGAYFCDECAWGSHRIAGQAQARMLQYCNGCEEMFCDGCFDTQTHSFCSRCYDTYCPHCRERRLEYCASSDDDDGPVCAACARAARMR